MKVLVVVDMQNDFVTGALGTKEAQEILPRVQEKINQYSHEPGCIILFTQDTHDAKYLLTQEGRNLPVEHCIEGTKGWELADNDWLQYSIPYRKGTFGSEKLVKDLKSDNALYRIDSIELVGVCTGICVLANAVLLKTALPEVPIKVDASCCACVTPESHQTALAAMQLLQIEVVNNASMD